MTQGHDDADDDEDEDDNDWSDEDSDSDVIRCPACGEDVYEDSPRCPACGKYLSEEDHPTSDQPRWVMITAVVVLLVMLSCIASYF